MSFRLVPKSVTLNDLERHNGPYFSVVMVNRTDTAVFCYL